jgi:cytochrome P450
MPGSSISLAQFEAMPLFVAFEYWSILLLSLAMLYWAAFTIGLLALVSGFLAVQVTRYFYDSKKLRRYTSLNWLAGITDLPWIWASIRLRRYRDLHNAHTFSTVIRIGPNALSFNSPRAAALIYGHGSPAIKPPYYDAGAGPFRNLADTRDKGEHSRKRRVLASGYALTTLLRWEDKIANRVQALLNQYDSKCLDGKRPSASTVVSLDHRRWMDLFTIDLINDVGLSAGMKLLEKGDDVFEVQSRSGETYTCRFRESLVTGHEVHTSFAWLPSWYNLIKRLTWWDARWQGAVKYTDIVTTQCKRRIDRYLAGEQLDDFFTHLLEGKGGKLNMLPLGEMVAECHVMLNAGSETTGIALSNCLYHLIKNPKCFTKLREEVDQVFAAAGSNSPVPAFEKVRYLPYLKACLDENLRLNPPSATTTPRMTPPQGMEILGEWVAGDTLVLCPTYSLHRTPEVFESPDTFLPERWLGEKATELQAAFLPFSGGARGCIGRNISFMEQQLLIAALVHRYDFELVSPTWEPVYEEAVTCSPTSLPIRVFRRNLDSISI